MGGGTQAIISRSENLSAVYCLSLCHLVETWKVMKSLKWPKQFAFVRQLNITGGGASLFYWGYRMSGLRCLRCCSSEIKLSLFICYLRTEVWSYAVQLFHLPLSVVTWFSEPSLLKHQGHDSPASVGDRHGAAPPNPRPTAALETAPGRHEVQVPPLAPLDDRRCTSSLPIPEECPAPLPPCCASCPSSWAASTAVWSSCWWWGCLSFCWWTPTTCLPPSRRTSSPTDASSTSTSALPVSAPAGAASSWTARSPSRPGAASASWTSSMSRTCTSPSTASPGRAPGAWCWRGWAPTRSWQI